MYSLAICKFFITICKDIIFFCINNVFYFFVKKKFELL